MLEEMARQAAYLPLEVWALLFLILGGLGLNYGSSWMVDGSSGIALNFGIRPIVIGMTIIAFGTSTPEWIVCMVSSHEGKDALTWGNIVGSNISNIALVLGLTALIFPLNFSSRVMKFEMPLTLLLSAVLIAMSLDGDLSRTDCGILLLIFVVYQGFVWKTAKDTESVPEELPENPGSTPANVFWTILGLIVLLVGGKVFVDGAVIGARQLNISEAVIGVSIVAIGTSLPELFASVVAALRKNSDIGVGNIVGSNLFNILWIMGIVGVIYPLSMSEKTTGRSVFLEYHGPMMLGVTLVLYALLKIRPVVETHGNLRVPVYVLNRWKGAVLLTLYVSYLVISYFFF